MVFKQGIVKISEHSAAGRAYTTSGNHSTHETHTEKREGRTELAAAQSGSDGPHLLPAQDIALRAGTTRSAYGRRTVPCECASSAGTERMRVSGRREFVLDTAPAFFYLPNVCLSARSVGMYEKHKNPHIRSSFALWLAISAEVRYTKSVTVSRTGTPHLVIHEGKSKWQRPRMRNTATTASPCSRARSAYASVRRSFSAPTGWRGASTPCLRFSRTPLTRRARAMATL